MDVPNSGAIFTLGKSYLAENTQSYFYIKNDPIKRLISGPHQSAVICESGRLFVWGENVYGQLGIGENAAIANAASNKASSNNNNNNNVNCNNNNNGENGDIIIKPTCVKSLKTLGLKIANIAYGNNWSAILTHSNELFFSGRNIFDDQAKVSHNFQTTTIANEKCSIIRKPIRLEEFDNCLSNSEETENFVAVLAGNEHFAVMTSFGRLIGWGSNKSHQLGAATADNNEEIPNREVVLQPHEMRLDAPVRQFACGPESTLVLTESGNLFLTGRLSELVFSEFVILQKNLSAAEQIIFMHISKANEIFIVTNAGSIYRSSESVRTKSLIFQRFYDYDSEENGPIWKLLKGSSFYAVLTKANKFYTTFSESGHHLKTFREISKFKNLRLLDMAVGDQHILVHGIPRSATLSAIVGPGGEHRFMSRSFVMPKQMTNGAVDGAGSERNETNENNVNKTCGADEEEMKRKDTPKPNTPINQMQAETTPTAPLAEHPNDEVRGNAKEDELDELPTEDKSAAQPKVCPENCSPKGSKSPAESLKSHKSAHSIRFNTSPLEKSVPHEEKLLRPRTPYPESSVNNTPQTIKKTPLRNTSYEAAMNNEYLDQISPPADAGSSLEHIPESADHEHAPITAIVSSPTPPTEEDEQLTVEINHTTDALDHTIVVNEIRFINNGIDVTENVQQNTIEFESEGDDEDYLKENCPAGPLKALETDVNEKTATARRQAEGLIDNLEQEIVRKVDQIAELKHDAKTQAAAAVNKIETDVEPAADSIESSTKNFAREAVDTVRENIKRSTNDTRNAVENAGQDAMRMAGEGRHAVENAFTKVAGDARHAVHTAFTKVATEAKHAVSTVTTKIGNEMQEAKDEIATLFQAKKTAHEDQPEDEPLVSHADDGTTYKENNNGDDERTTASVNSTQNSSAGGGNPFESDNPFESGNPFEDEVDEHIDKGKQMVRHEINVEGREIEQEQRNRTGLMRQFFDDVRAKSKGISCRNEKSIQIDDEPPRYSISDEQLTTNKRHQNSNGSKVCTIL